MTALTQQIKLQRDSLTEGGFAGHDGSWSGIGDFVYFADARFMPYGETHMHSHHEVDVISVMVDGKYCPPRFYGTWRRLEG